MQTNAATYFEPRKHYSYLPTNKDSLGPGFLTYKFRIRIAPSQRDDCQIQHRYLPGYIQRRIAMIMDTYVCIDIYARVYVDVRTQVKSVLEGGHCHSSLKSPGGAWSMLLNWSMWEVLGHEEIVLKDIGTRLAGRGFPGCYCGREGPCECGVKGSGLRAQGNGRRRAKQNQNFSRQQAFDSFSGEPEGRLQNWTAHLPLTCASGSSKPVFCNPLFDVCDHLDTRKGEVFMQPLDRSGRFLEADLFVSGHIPEVSGLLRGGDFPGKLNLPLPGALASL